MSWDGIIQWLEKYIPNNLGLDQQTPDDPRLVPSKEETTPTASTNLSVDQEVHNYEGLVPVVEVKVPPNYNKESEINYYNKDGLVSDIAGNAQRNKDGTFTDRQGHTIMSDENGKPIRAADSPKYYSWYKLTPKDIGSIFAKLTNDWEYRVSPDSTIGNDRELTEEDINNGYHLETKLGVQFRFDNLGGIHPDDEPDYLELIGHYSALFSHFDNVMETAKDGNAQYTKSSSDPLEFKFGYIQSDGSPVYNATAAVIAQGSSKAEDGNVTQDTKSGSDPEFKLAGIQSDGTPLFYATKDVTVQGNGTASKSDASAFDKLKNYLNQNSELLKYEGEAAADYAIGKLVIDELRNTFTIGKQSALGLGPAGTIEVRVDTTPGSVITLKGVAKVFGGVVSLGQTSYDVYVDYKTFGFTGNFAKVAAADIGTTAVVGLGSVGAVTLGAPVIVVAGAGGILLYLVNEEFINPWKKSLKSQK